MWRWDNKSNFIPEVKKFHLHLCPNSYLLKILIIPLDNVFFVPKCHSECVLEQMFLVLYWTNNKFQPPCQITYLGSYRPLCLFTWHNEYITQFVHKLYNECSPK